MQVDEALICDDPIQFQPVFFLVLVPPLAIPFPLPLPLHFGWCYSVSRLSPQLLPLYLQSINYSSFYHNIELPQKNIPSFVFTWYSSILLQSVMRRPPSASYWIGLLCYKTERIEFLKNPDLISFMIPKSRPVQGNFFPKILGL